MRWNTLGGGANYQLDALLFFLLASFVHFKKRPSTQYGQHLHLCLCNPRHANHLPNPSHHKPAKRKCFACQSISCEQIASAITILSSFSRSKEAQKKELP